MTGEPAPLARVSDSAQPLSRPMFNSPATPDYDEVPDEPAPETSGAGVKSGVVLLGLLLCGGGIAGTMLGYQAAVQRGGGRYVIFTGPIVCGISMIIRACAAAGRG